MYSKQAELDTINTELNFMKVGDPVPVNNFDEHDLHIEEHTKQLEALKKSFTEETKLGEIQVSLLEAHIALHKQMKMRI